MSGRTLRIIAAVAIGIVILIVGGACWFLLRIQDPLPFFSEVSAENVGRSVRIEGLVVENNRGCERNGECYLRLELDGQEIIMIYDYGEERHCLNEEAAAKGKQIAEGDQVVVYGKVTGEGEVTTCEFESDGIDIGQREAVRPTRLPAAMS